MSSLVKQTKTKQNIINNAGGGGGQKSNSSVFNNFETDIRMEIIRFFGHLAFCHSKMCNLYSVICYNSTITSVRLYAHKIMRSFEKVKVQI